MQLHSYLLAESLGWHELQAKDIHTDSHLTKDTRQETDDWRLLHCPGRTINMFDSESVVVRLLLERKPGWASTDNRVQDWQHSRRVVDPMTPGKAL